MESSKKQSSARAKPSKGRPTSTSTISQHSQTSTPQIFSSFSPDGNLFAFIVLAIDKHRLRVFNTATGRASAEYTFESGRATSLAWGASPTSSFTQGSHSPNKKRKKGIDTISQEAQSPKNDDVVIIGLSDGTVIYFSPSHSKILHRLTHPTSTFAILALAFNPNNKSHLWTSGADSSIRLWDSEKNTVLKVWKNDDRIPCTSLSVRQGDGLGDILVAHHNIRLFAVRTPDESSSNKPKQIAAFTGHATSIKSLVWLSGSNTRFFSMAEADRFVHFWNIDNTSAIEKPVASTSLDSDVRAIVLGRGPSSQNTLITLSTLGKLAFIPVPETLHSNGDNTEGNILLPRSTLSSLLQSRPQDPLIVDLVPLSNPPASLRVVRLAKGVQPIFDTITYLDDDGNYIQNLSLGEINDLPATEGKSSASNKRYVEPKSLAVAAGYDDDGGEQAMRDHEPDGSLQVDLAELSLGQRLAVTDADMNIDSDSENDGVTDLPRGTRSGKKQMRAEATGVPANSLTRTLIQALHSSDSRLLEMCLSHSEPVLISNTVKRLPPQLAIPLITACVERLGRGPRSANMKGSGGGASAQRGSGLLVWLRSVLAVHTGHLMTIPDLVARLSGLHSILTARLSLQESLLSLSGRLDMVLSQVELRASRTPTSLAPSKVDKNKSKTLVKRYVEGDDTDSGEEPDEKMDVEVEVNSDSEGSIEYVGLGGESEDEDEDESEASGSDDGAINGFIDDEAEEEYSDEEDDESE